MSGVVTAIGLAVGATAAAAATVGTIILVSVILMVVSIGFSIYSMMSMKKGFNDNAKSKDRTHVVRSSIEPRAYIYGQAMVSGPLVYVLSTGSNNSLLYMVVALAGHQVQAIGDVYLGDKLSTDPVFSVPTPEQGHWQDIYETDYEGNNVCVGQEWIIDVPASTRSRVQITKYLGAADQLADSELISASGGQWTSEHRLRGVAYIIVKLEYDSKSFPNGIPNVKAVVTGNNQIYDPRTDTYGYSNNWALCMYDYLSKGYGIKCDGGEINLTQAILAADISDEDVVLAAGGTEKRFTCNGVFSCEEKPISIMQKLLSGALGSIVWSQGQYFINPAVYKTPETYVITESDIVDSITVTPEKSTRDKFNIVKGVFIDPTQYWKPIDFPQVKNSAAITKDGQELFEDITLDFTTSVSTAQRLAKIHLERELQSIVVSFTGKLTMFGFKPGDVVPLTLSYMGWSEKLFKIVNWELTENANVSIILREESSAIYDWNSGMETIVDPAPNTMLPDPFDVPTPVITVSDDLVFTAGAVVSRLVVDIDESTDVFVSRYETEVRRRGDQDWITIGTAGVRSVLVGVLDGNTYDVRCRAYNMLGVSSDDATAMRVIVGKTAPPAAVTGLQAELTRGQMRIYWNANADVDIAGYELQLGTVWDDPANKVLVQNYAGTSYAWTPDRTGIISILAKSIDTSGNYSTTATRLDYTISVPGTVATLTQQVIDNIVELKWSAAAAGSFPIDYYEVWKGGTFATAELLGRKYSTFDLLQETVAGTYKYWIRAVDVAGLAGAETGVYAAVNQPPDYVLIDQQNLVFEECTLTNAMIENGQVVMPINTTISFVNHFISNPDTTLDPWSTPQDQIDDGYPLYGQPAPATASIERLIDYGAVIPSSKLTMSVTRTALAGNVTFTPELLVSTDGGSYTSLGNVYESAATGFRYAKYRLVATTTDGGMAAVQQINVKLDVKQKTKVVNTINVTDTVSDGTQVTFASLGLAPVDITGIVAEAPYTGNATNDPIKALVNFVDAPNPTSFKVLCWNKSGTRVACNGVTVTIRYI